MHTLFLFGVKDDKSPLIGKPDIVFDIPFNPASAIPVLDVVEEEKYVSERFLSFVELALLFKITDEHFFNADVAVLIQLIFFAAVSALMRLWLFPKKYYDKKNCSLSVSPSISNNGITSFFVKQLWNY
ncbi:MULTISPECIES: hypothetical protein [Enterobacter]|uniref:Uncharacterized protein n=1 Tax=Enterobacter rongchengensis TaxID=3030999 RepID=A0ABV4JDM9_9ENTR|nr:MULTISPECIES: hypothetical protein [Enterobacter]PNL53718.1 hypothetical protein CEP65_013165 [Enterobacter hormaechei]HCR0839640.1 hypothetical protein [Enterobacter cancerogenus]EKX4012090.1 hypothetical protein [Enterobacter cloacae]ELV3044464.1 hypothetical protein [Enterobacter chengduensis]KJM05135.1 hypothetical protein SS39_07025 [Enterobacter chengduensis]